MANDKEKSKRIQNTLQKGMISKIREKARKGEKDEFGIPFASHYKAVTGKNVEKAEPKKMNKGGSVKKADITTMSYKELDKYIKDLKKPLPDEKVKPVKKSKGGAVLSNRGGSFKGVR